MTATQQQYSPLGQQIMKLVRKIDRNTRAIVKVVSAADHLDDRAEKSQILEDARFALMQLRRNMRADLEDLLKKQPNWKG